MKDYFAILGVRPSADISEIKQAYRKLAMDYHPDKHKQDPEKTVLYDQIREAYEILTEPGKRVEYLQERWLMKATGTSIEGKIISGDVILKKTIELNRQLRFTDPDRINENRIKYHFNQVVSDEMIAVLSKQNDRELNGTIVSILIDTLWKLPLSLCSELIPQISQIPTDDTLIQNKCADILKQKREALFWEKSKIWIVILLTILLCAGIAFLA